MADKPANTKLWNMLIVQAKSKFGTWPSLPASKWVHHQYIEKGGQFISAKDATRIKKATERKTGEEEPKKDKPEKGRK